jgi:TNF receptor-associated factor 4
MLHKKLVREVNSLVICCPEKELGCEWEGELGQLQRHLNPGAGVTSAQGCEFLTVECAYRCGAQLQRRLIQEHEMEVCLNRPIEMQVASLLKKFEAIDAENKLLRQELKEMKSAYEGEINQLKRKLDKNDGACDTLKENQKENSKVLKGLEEKCNALQNHMVPLSLPPFYFIVLNIDHFLERNMDFDSAPFYSHPGGYKMHVSVESNVERGNRCGYLNLYVSIIRGEFDDQLKWPLDGEITVQAYNRTLERWTKEEKIQLNKEECDLEVVGRKINILSSGGWGCLKWLSFRDLKAHFVKDTNTLRLRVVSVKINSI